MSMSEAVLLTQTLTQKGCPHIIQVSMADRSHVIDALRDVAAEDAGVGVRQPVHQGVDTGTRLIQDKGSLPRR